MQNIELRLPVKQ